MTCIELLSLSNKTPGEHGRYLYLRKQREILYGKVHLVEIDLLRGGEHTTAVPWHRLAKVAGEFEYHVSIHRFDNLEDFFVYPIRLNQPLPEIAIPLLPGDPRWHWIFNPFSSTYDAGPYFARSTTGKTRQCRRWVQCGENGSGKSWPKKLQGNPNASCHYR